MVKKAKQESEKNEGASRKERTGLPQVSLVAAIQYTKKAYDEIGSELKSFTGLAEAMGMNEAHAKRAFGELKDQYGLIEQEGGGWKISELGRRASIGDKAAVIEMIQKAKILGDLYNNLKDKKVSTDYISDFIKKKRYAYNIKIPHVTERYLEIMRYLGELGGSTSALSHETHTDTPSTSVLLKSMQLLYALEPPNKADAEQLAEGVAKALKETNDPAFTAFAESIADNKNNHEVLTALAKSVVNILSKRYPDVLIETKHAKKAEPKNPE